jgi:hypothetical protein
MLCQARSELRAGWSIVGIGRYAMALAVILLITSPVIARAHSVNSGSKTNAAQAQAMTRSLVELYARYAAAPRSDKPRLQRDLVETARARYQFLAETLDEDAAAVLGAALPASTRSRLPSFLMNHLEEGARIDGTLEILHEDSDAGNRYRYFVHSAGIQYSLHFASRAPDHLLTGARIRVKGIRFENMLALDGANNVQQLAAAPIESTFGEQRTLLILVNFSDAPVQPYTTEDARNVLFGTTSQFYLENSFQQTWLNGDGAGWFTIATTSTVCDTASIATEAQSAATAVGIDLASYAHLVYAFPQNYSCGFWGRSSVGGSPSQSWINGDFELGVTAHEFGHAMGLWHSHSVECGNNTLGSNCTASEYGDMFDMMGASSFAHFNAFQKERLGWLNYNASPTTTTVKVDGTYVLDAYELAASGPKALKILKSIDATTGNRTWYYIQSRQAIGFDTGLANNLNVLNGVLIHYATEGSGNSSYLVDMTPASGSTTYLDWSDPALTVGETFTDPQTGMTITPNWVTATAAAVTVKFVQSGGASTTNVAIATDRATYTLNQSVTVTATVTSAGSPVAKVAVKLAVKKPNGSIVSGNVTTGSNGVAVYKLRLSRRDPTGTYEADATMQSTSGMTHFAVQ